MFAYTTYITERYVEGAMCVARCLITNNSKYPFIVMCLGIDDDTKAMIEDCGATCIDVERVQSEHANGPRYTKLNAFNLTDYERVMWLDSDIAILDNIDSVFETQRQSACEGVVAAVKYKHIYYTGQMLIEPSEALFRHLVELAETTENVTGGDQPFLNEVIPVHTVTDLGKEYGLLGVWFDLKKKEIWDQFIPFAKIIHYSRAVPWEVEKHNCNQLGKLWWDCFEHGIPNEERRTWLYG